MFPPGHARSILNNLFPQKTGKPQKTREAKPERGLLTTRHETGDSFRAEESGVLGDCDRDAGIGHWRQRSDIHDG